MKINCLFTALLFSISLTAKAGIYTDDLSRCLIESATAEDKITLVRWMFTAMALHPAIKDMSNVSGEQRRKANMDMAELMVDLVTEKCLDKSKKAIEYEGEVALQSSFNLFGQIAGRELFANADVAKGLSDLDEYLEKDKLNSRLGIQE